MQEMPMARTSLIFSGHMVDLPTRLTPRFPRSIVPRAEIEIGKAVRAAISSTVKDEVRASLPRGGDTVPDEFAHRIDICPARLHGEARVAVPLTDVVVSRVAVLGLFEEPDYVARCLEKIDEKPRKCSRARLNGQARCGRWQGVGD